ncbi:hypothetical protein QBC41DRAFT_348301 [Cercophora samala]|uniref:Uncharacterized protein n=1 Tax=Cercophora samala TaxID=330535 RepID=A0AA39ZB51_9PEZI|nr:hypothetical protein QBC41DRAFT_348301 [Cercophora samala]
MQDAYAQGRWCPLHADARDALQGYIDGHKSEISRWKQQTLGLSRALATTELVRRVTVLNSVLAARHLVGFMYKAEARDEGHMIARVFVKEYRDTHVQHIRELRVGDPDPADFVGFKSFEWWMMYFILQWDLFFADPERPPPEPSSSICKQGKNMTDIVARIIMRNEGIDPRLPRPPTIESGERKYSLIQRLGGRLYYLFILHVYVPIDSWWFHAQVRLETL